MEYSENDSEPKLKRYPQFSALRQTISVASIDGNEATESTGRESSDFDCSFQRLGCLAVVCSN